MGKKKDEKRIFADQEKHPAFGMISLHKVSATPGVPLFGSSVRHSRFIMLRVHKATRSRELNSDYYFEGNTLIEVRISPVQLSELLTSLNTTGVPCTLKRYRDEDGKFVDAGECPETSKAEKTYQEFIEHVNEVTERLRLLQQRAFEQAQRQSVGKKERAALAEDIRRAAQEIDANMPFIMKRFGEKVEETVRDAKGEIEAFIAHKVEATGVAALKRAAPDMVLLEGKSVETDDD